MLFAHINIDRFLILLAILLCMLPATFLWGIGMGGIPTAVNLAINGSPLLLIYLIAGALGIIGIILLYRIAAFNCHGRIKIIFSLLTPAWIAMIFFVWMNPSIPTFSIAVGPIIVSLVLIYLSWERLHYKPL
ncbi:MAG: hypothetical protein HRT38_12130 [Alteromonadaceae bacterium]|nr:hypothetical protein [Alteromonadaceae bacterium]